MYFDTKMNIDTKMNNCTKINIITFNKMHWSEQAKIFDEEFGRDGAITRSPPVSLWNRYAYFVFLSPVALVRLTSDERNIYFALSSNETKFCLDLTIALHKDKADERGCEFGDCELAYAYIASGEWLKNQIDTICKPIANSVDTTNKTGYYKHMDAMQRTSPHLWDLRGGV